MYMHVDIDTHTHTRTHIDAFFFFSILSLSLSLSLSGLSVRACAVFADALPVFEGLRPRLTEASLALLGIIVLIRIVPLLL